MIGGSTTHNLILYFNPKGQNCAGLERMIVQEGKTYDRLIADLTRIVGDLRLGSAFDDEVDLGAITMKHQVDI